MSNRARHRRVRSRSQHWVSVMMAWAQSGAELDEALRKTHDALIEQLGDRRRSGVTWRIYEADAASRVLRKSRGHHASLTTELDEYYSKLEALISTRGGHLVVATADAIRPS